MGRGDAVSTALTVHVASQAEICMNALSDDYYDTQYVETSSLSSADLTGMCLFVWHIMRASYLPSPTALTFSLQVMPHIFLGSECPFSLPAVSNSTYSLL